MRLRTSLALVTALGATTVPIAASSASRGPDPGAFRKAAARVCRAERAEDFDRSAAFLREHPALGTDLEAGRVPTDPADRATFATFLRTSASGGLGANRRLSRLSAPRSARARWSRALRLDRAGRATTLTSAATLLNAPASPGNTTAVEALDRRTTRLQSQAEAAFLRVGVRGC